MELTAKNIGKRFGYDWIFRNIDLSFTSKKRYALTGPNGSGKSTLLRILAGSIAPSEGELLFSLEGQFIDMRDFYTYIGFTAPYLELPEELTLLELIRFHFKFKKYPPTVAEADFINLLQLDKHLHKQIQFYSSGMKQRVKLGLAVLCDAPLLFLDEPSTNLDEAGVQWYLNLISDYAKDKTLFIASNRSVAYDFCDETMFIPDWK